MYKGWNWLWDDFEGVAVGVGDGGEVGAGGCAQGLPEDGHAGGLQALDEGIDSVFAADRKCQVCVSAGLGGGVVDCLAGGAGVALWPLHQFDAGAAVGRVHKYDACAGGAGDFRFGFHTEVCAVELAQAVDVGGGYCDMFDGHGCDV